MNSRRELFLMAGIAALLIAALFTLVAPSGPGVTPSTPPSESPSEVPSVSPSADPGSGLPSADPFRVLVIDATGTPTTPLALCADGTMTVDLSFVSEAVGPVDLFLLRDTAIGASTPAGVRDAAERANGVVLRAEPGSVEIVVMVAPPGSGPITLVTVLSRLEASPVDPEEQLEVPVDSSITDVLDAGC